jgi:adenosylhomocysteine nucleosidase
MVLGDEAGNRTKARSLMRLLLVASDRMEYTGILNLMEAQQTTRVPVRWSRSGRLNGHEIVLAANGVGQERAAAAVDAGCSALRPDAVISTGFCGALDPELQIADVIVGTCVVRAERRYAALPVSSARAHAAGTVCSVDHVVQTAAEKSSLRREGHSAVEMEAGGVASRAEALGLGFFCIRAVTDLAGEDLANDYNRALRPDGRFATMRIFRYALDRPVARLPELVRLRRNCARAAETLGDFFADCRF